MLMHIQCTFAMRSRAECRESAAELQFQEQFVHRATTMARNQAYGASTCLVGKRLPVEWFRVMVYG